MRTLSTAGTEVGELQIDLSSPTEFMFVEALSASDLFHGTLLGCKDLADVEKRIRDRLNAYRRFLHMNDRKLNTQIQASKTDIGTTISGAVELLKGHNVIGRSVNVFIHIDQYEALVDISAEEKLSPDYRRVINRALARRDPTVSYRIGTRGHAWRNHGFIFGADARLEEERDYKFVDLDLILRRHENRKTWVFPRFAYDVFGRRLKYAGLAPHTASGRELLRKILGTKLSPKQKAIKYAGTTSRSKAIKVDPEWPLSFRHKIEELAETDPLAARMLEAWVLQQLHRPSRKGVSSGGVSDLDISMLSVMESKVWWKKERTELALIQIAGRCAQRPLWSGDAEIVELSGGNILTFLSICQFIWDTDSQVGRTRRGETDLVLIDVDVQAIGVFKASEYWLRKITQETGHSGDRYRLVKHIGTAVNRALYNDRKLSYPGFNGFSLADEDLHKYPHVREILEEMSDYGTVVAGPHTTKERDRRQRQKFYLSPILCPQFKIPYKRLKEPRYIQPSDLENWMYHAKVPLPQSYQPRKERDADPTQGILPFPEYSE